jgi:hypothetical protein
MRGVWANILNVFHIHEGLIVADLIHSIMLGILLEKIIGHTINGRIYNAGEQHTLIALWSYANVESAEAVPTLNFLAENGTGNKLSVVGVHIAEYEFQKSTGNVIKEIESLRISFPVYQDNTNEIWGLLNATGLPAYFLFDSSGALVAEMISNNDLLEYAMDFATDAGVYFKKGIVRQVKRSQIYLGTLRGRKIEEIVDHTGEEEGAGAISKDRILVRGDWLQDTESIRATADGDELLCEFRGSELFAVVCSGWMELAIFENGEHILRPDPISSNLVSVINHETNEIMKIKIRAKKNFEIYSIISGRS